MKRISIYAKGGLNSTSYYRIYQYTNKMPDYQFFYRTMMSDKMYDKLMPVSKKNIIIKILAYIYIYIRVLYYLVYDSIYKPDTIIIARRVISRFMPFSYKWLLKFLSKKTHIIWDFDDDIITGGEVSKETFNFYAKISNIIVCTHKYLKDLIPSEYQHKVVILPTTDGDMYEQYINSDIDRKRANELHDTVKLVWVATSVNIPHLISISDVLDKAAKRLMVQAKKQLSLEVICDKELKYDFKYLKLINTKWTRKKAINGMMQSHIGIMPLIDTKFSKGKGGFKLVQYLSVGLPCIASNVGFNNSVINCSCGFLINSDDEWITAIEKLSETYVWEKYSKNSFKTWSKNFSFSDNLQCWKKLLNERATKL